MYVKYVPRNNFVNFVNKYCGYFCLVVTENHLKWPSRHQKLLKIIKYFCPYRKIPSSTYQIEKIQGNIASQVQKIDQVQEMESVHCSENILYFQQIQISVYLRKCRVMSYSIKFLPGPGFLLDELQRTSAACIKLFIFS